MSEIAEPTLGGPVELHPEREPEAARPSIRSVKKTRSWWSERTLADWMAFVSLGILLTVFLAAIAPSWLAPFAPTDMSSDAILSPPNWQHWFGTDQFGRDVFSLVIFGARQSLVLGLSAVAISCSVGVSIGIACGYEAGVFDKIVMRIIDIWMAIPNILLALAIAAALGANWVSIILSVSVVSMPRYARVLRSQALALRGQPFILAARAAGASHFSILRRHVLPHCMPITVVIATVGIGTSILLGSSLSFLGLGVNDERPDWGYLLTQGRSYLTVAWWTVTYPGLAITALVVSANLLGDAMRRWLDPRSVRHIVIARRAKRS